MKVLTEEGVVTGYESQDKNVSKEEGSFHYMKSGGNTVKLKTQEEYQASQYYLIVEFNPLNVQVFNRQDLAADPLQPHPRLPSLSLNPAVTHFPQHFKCVVYCAPDSEPLHLYFLCLQYYSTTVRLADRPTLSVSLGSLRGEAFLTLPGWRKVLSHKPP